MRRALSLENLPCILARGIALVCVASWAAASPLDLSDPTPRWIEVRFEVSPHTSPGRLDQVWGRARRAFLEPVPEEKVIRIRVPAEELIAQLRSTGANPIDGTFSEFVWTLDPLTGHVVEAEMNGQLREAFAIGFLRSTTLIEIRVELTTHRAAGFRPARELLGQSAHAYCTEFAAGGDCTVVEPAIFDPSRGYVNAVGFLRAATPIAQLRTFSPLGEVVFTEQPPNF